MANLYLDLCLSDIPKERIKTARNGKKYIKAIIKPRREADADGYDHYVAAFIPAAERQQDDKPAFFGRAQLKDEQRHVGGQDFRRESHNTLESRVLPKPPIPANNNYDPDLGF